MEFLPTISTFFILLSAILVAIGWRLIAKDKRAAHKKAMLAAAVSALLFFIIYVSRTIFVGNTSFGGPEELQTFYTIFLVFHIVLATTGGVFGLVTLRLALKRKITTHRKLGPITSIIWFFSALTGIMVYLLLYVLFDGGETTSLIRAIFGM
jgi:putative membrane protein